MRLDPNRPTVDQLRPLVEALYAKPGGGSGCCLHIALDDGNVSDHCIKFCLENAIENGHADCEEIARMMLKMSKTQRSKRF